MEQFVVSARKYRPVTFDSVVGQSHITTTLKNAIKTEHLAQAFLFCGPRGVGKTTCARILAKTINCQNVGADTEPCNECTSCKNFAQNASFNIHELDAASNNSVEDIRNLIDQVRFPPQDGKFKVYIIDEVHMLSSAAFNAFLKTLEEPPSYAIFILATTEKHKILPTILSRCQIFDFNRIQIKDMASHLAEISTKEGIESEPEALELIAQKADGGLRDALSMFDLNVTFSTDKKLTYAEVLENLHVLDYDYYFKITDALFAGDLSESLLVLNEILEKGFDGHQFVTGLNGHFRNLLVGKDSRTIDLMEVSTSVKQKYLDQTKKLSQGFLMSALSIGSQVDLSYKSAKNQRLHVEIGLMKMASISQVLNLSTLPNGEAEKKNSTSLSSSNKSEDSIPAEVTKVPPPPVEKKAAVGTKPKFKSSKLRSTVDLEEEVLKTEIKTVAKKENAQEIVANKPYTLEDVKAGLLACTKIMQRQSQQMILKSNFDLSEEGVITLKLVNQTLMDLFDESKQDILDFVRKQIQNNSLQLTAILVAAKNEGKPRTEQEKFKAMLDKNPALKDFKDELGLDLIY
ncbi:DNA polymerase III subunit gamma/tau [Arcticibacterium luteifluviistationis]|uniref:DNA polymerase III subunit gamma/tau n=1 Tax=Arcticibacterium luteifluviistationis TaxID=1784714 RepID=A0A2Z4G9Q1_9BACT|nr:DNA polymerase III subunit gamma/tau [Arcticibacterium luteifluviistationis]AWV97874.1 DNA polymerase III subunit gamma/tau [Arcticibacterium luteifluviistationis]